MGVFAVSLEGHHYSCKYSPTRLTLAEDILSRVVGLLTLFYYLLCRHGKTYLFDNCVNITLGEKEDRMMMTGLHTVVDIFCVGCGANLGWKYEAAYDKSQKYKEGTFILQRFQILGTDGSYYVSSHEGHSVVNDAAEAFIFL